jgi:hypothetical protein
MCAQAPFVTLMAQRAADQTQSEMDRMMAEAFGRAPRTASNAEATWTPTVDVVPKDNDKILDRRWLTTDAHSERVKEEEDGGHT